MFIWIYVRPVKKCPSFKVQTLVAYGCLNLKNKTDVNNTVFLLEYRCVNAEGRKQFNYFIIVHAITNRVFPGISVHCGKTIK